MKKIAIAALLTVISLAAFAQVPPNIRAKEIYVPYSEGTELRALFTGKDATPITGGKGEVLVHEFEMIKFGKTTNDIEIIIKAPVCFFDYTERKAWSTNHIEVFGGRTNYYIEGDGFAFLQTSTNAFLNISNKVHTILKRESETETNAPLEIFSDRFKFVGEKKDEGETRIATYTGNIRVEDTEFQLGCGLLTADLPSGTNKLRNIIADKDVEIVSKRHGSRAKGDHAVYDRGDVELITLSGNPTWADAQTEAKADIFMFDRTAKTVAADGNAYLKIRGGVSGPQLGGKAKPASSTNQPVEITSDFLFITLPQTNGGARYLAAKTNVVILSPADGSRAVGEHAEFIESKGVLKLTGNAEWKSDRFIAKGGELTLNRSNQVLNVDGGKADAFLTLLPETKTNSSKDAQPVEVQCNRYEVTTNLARFFSASESPGSRGVIARFTESGVPSTLTCDDLSVTLVSNQVENVFATGSVTFDQKATDTNANVKSLEAQKVTLKRWPSTGLTRSVDAQENVHFKQHESKNGKVEDIDLSSAVLNLKFAERTNQLERLTAEKDVQVKRGLYLVTGQRLDFDMKKGFAEMTGDPIARTDKVIWYGGDRLHWYPDTGKIWSRPLIMKPVDPSVTPKELLSK